MHRLPPRIVHGLGVVVLLFGGDARAQSTNLTVKATTQRSISGTGTLDRARFFNHWGTHVPPTNTNLGDLAREVWAPDGLNSVTGRETFEFDWFTRNVPEDPSNPGFFQASGLVSEFQGAYRNWVLSNIRWNRPNTAQQTHGPTDAQQTGYSSAQAGNDGNKFAIPSPPSLPA
ncbi:hypothetical protein OAS39_12320 [Pirellulales bacterium]|nr:hypothetical protein [Pirellulales bacterium]